MERYYASLLATLLHDIPWKPWVVTGRLAGRDLLVKIYAEKRGVKDLKDYVDKLIESVEHSCGDSEELERNDREAIALLAMIIYTMRKRGAEQAAKVLEDVVVSEWCKDIHEVDVIASSVDRQISPRIGSAKYFVNMFYPLLRVPLFQLDVRDLEDVVERYLDSVREVVEIVIDVCKEDAICILQKLYYVLYTLAETEWYRAVGGVRLAIPVADTRVPNHTVFDHLRAATMAYGVRSRALYIHVDIPGVHAFISAARKTRDFWSSSWLLSLLVWSTIRPIVEKLGPQTVLMPALHFNPFYIDLLLRDVKAVERRIPKILWVDGWPSQPVMPATTTLILDTNSIHILDLKNSSCSDVEEYLEKSFRNSWYELFYELREKIGEWRSRLRDEGAEVLCDINTWLKQGATSPCESALRLVCLYALSATSNLRASERRAALSKLLETLLDYLEEATKKPPLSIHVQCVEVEYGGDYEKFVEEFVEVLKSVEFSNGESPYDVLSRMLRKKDVKEILRNILRLLYAQKIMAEKMLSKPNVSPSYSLGISDSVAKLWKTVRDLGIGARGYRYCSICGRLPAVARFPRIGESVETLSGEKIEVAEIMLYALQKAVEYLADEGESLCPYCLLKRLLGRAPSMANRLLFSVGQNGKAKHFNSTTAVANWWLKEFRNMLEEFRKDGIDPREASDTIIDSLISSRRELGVKFYNHIAILYGDGDSMGKGYLRGILAPFSKLTHSDRVLGIELEKVLNYVQTSKKIKELMIPSIGYYIALFRSAHGVDPVEDVEVRKAVLLNSILVAIASSMLFDRGGHGKAIAMTILPSLSYMQTLSSALMVSALVDATIVDGLGGVVIYAGGDDVLAVMPAAAPRNGDGSDVEHQLLQSVVEKLRSIGARVPSIKAITGINFEGEYSVGWIAALLTRLNYWGFLSGVPGFHVYEGIFVQALPSHGRSYGINIAHHRKPLWEAFSEAYNLMKVKEGVSILVRDESGQPLKRGIDKDVAIVGFEGCRQAIVPFSLASVDERLSLELLEVGPLGIASKLLHGLETGSRVYDYIVTGRYSTSLLYDIDGVITILDEASSRLYSSARDSHQVQTLVERIVFELFERNRKRRDVVVDERLVRDLVRVSVYTDSARSRLLVYHVFLMCRNLLASARRG